MELVTIRAFDNYFSANILLTRLRDAGVQCYLKDEYTVTLDPLLSNAIGGIKLVIRKEDLPEVTELLQSFDNDYKMAVQCPKCGSNDIILVPKAGVENMITAISTWLFSSYAMSGENVYKCNQCGFESDTLPEPPNAQNN